MRTYPRRSSRPGTAAPPRRSDSGRFRYTERDIAGLILAGDMYGLPYDLAGAALRAQPARVRAIAARWSHAGLTETGRIGPGPSWCWLTPRGMRATGLRYPARRPPLARLAHIRAVLAVRLALEATSAYADGAAWWRSERQIRSDAARLNPGHVPDAEVIWPGLPGTPEGTWAIETELTPKPVDRTAAIITGLLTMTAEWEPGAPPQREPRYGHVIYLCAPAALPMVRRAAAALPGPLTERLDIRGLPQGALL